MIPYRCHLVEAMAATHLVPWAFVHTMRAATVEHMEAAAAKTHPLELVVYKASSEDLVGVVATGLDTAMVEAVEWV